MVASFVWTILLYVRVRCVGGVAYTPYLGQYKVIYLRMQKLHVLPATSPC